jgi:hypothetical protein
MALQNWTVVTFCVSTPTVTGRWWSAAGCRVMGSADAGLVTQAKSTISKAGRHM